MAANKSYHYVGFSRGSGGGSWLIGWMGAGYWSHAFTLVDANHVIDARSDKVGGQPPGVYERPISYLDEDERLILKFSTSSDKVQHTVKLLQSQIKKPYDFSPGIIDIAMGHLQKPGYREWREPDSWFCSELQTWAPETARMIPRTPYEFNRIEPGMACYGWFNAGATEVVRLAPGERWQGLGTYLR